MEAGLFILGAVIVIGVVGHILFNRTKIPESLFLILAGIIVGPVLGWAPREFFLDNISFFVTIALVIILLNAGLNLDLYRTVKNAWHSLIFTVTVMAATVVLVALTVHHFFGWSPVHGMFLGILVSGTTAVTIVHLVRELKIDRATVLHDTKNILTIEAVLSDLLVIVGASVLLSLGEQPLAGQGLAVLLFNQFIVSLIAGTLLGGAWVYFYVKKLHGSKLGYISTVGAAFILYFLAEYLGINGALTVMMFALILGNNKVIVETLRVKTKLFKGIKYDVGEMKKTDTEFTFLITAFFFFILGVIFDLDVLQNTLIMSLALAVVGAKLIARYISALSLTNLHDSFKQARFVHTTMMACGLATALMAFLAIDSGVKIEFLAEIVLLIIIFTTVVSIIGTGIQERKTLNVIEDRQSR